jgi:hypothetical protein
MADEYVDISLPWQEIARNARTQLYLRNPAVIKLLCMKHGGCGQKERALQRSSKLELTAYRATPLGEVACNLPSVGPPHPEERERGSSISQMPAYVAAQQPSPLRFREKQESHSKAFWPGLSSLQLSNADASLLFFLSVAAELTNADLACQQ